MTKLVDEYSDVGVQLNSMKKDGLHPSNPNLSTFMTTYIADTTNNYFEYYKPLLYHTQPHHYLSTSLAAGHLSN